MELNKKTETRTTREVKVNRNDLIEAMRYLLPGIPSDCVIKVVSSGVVEPMDQLIFSWEEMIVDEEKPDARSELGS